MTPPSNGPVGRIASNGAELVGLVVGRREGDRTLLDGVREGLVDVGHLKGDVDDPVAVLCGESRIVPTSFTPRGSPSARRASVGSLGTM